jgi:hypothetical protein
MSIEVVTKCPHLSDNNQFHSTAVNFNIVKIGFINLKHQFAREHCYENFRSHFPIVISFAM